MLQPGTVVQCANGRDRYRETTSLHTSLPFLTWSGELSATSRHADGLAVLLPCSMMWVSQAKLWFLQELSLHLCSHVTQIRHKQGKNSQASIIVILIRACIVRRNQQTDQMEYLPTSTLDQPGSSASTSTMMSDLIGMIAESSQRSSSLPSYFHETSSL